MWRVVLGILAGAVAAIGIISIIEAIGHAIYPPPPGAAMTTPDAVAAYIAAAPTMALAFPPIGWFSGAAIGGWLARVISRRSWAGWGIAALVLAGGIINLFLVPAPLWMQIAAVAAPLSGGWAATRMPVAGIGAQPLHGPAGNAP